MTDLRGLRSLLYVPACNPAAIQSARNLTCDAIIICLEAATPEDKKDEGRRGAIAELDRGGFAARHVIVRVNGLDTEWGALDLGALKSARPDAILVPGVRNAADVHSYDSLVAAPLWVMLETADAVLNLREIASTATDTRLAAFVMGTNDLASSFGARPRSTREVFLPVFTWAVAAARASGLAVYDGIFMDVNDDKGFRSQCEQAIQFGFDGKTLFSPRQIDVCNEVLARS